MQQGNYNPARGIKNHLHLYIFLRAFVLHPAVVKLLQPYPEFPFNIPDNKI
jgi:hypothetical protein